jgi:alkylation response protein AidB-like acyl-CoA dehydrogenase
VDFAPTADQVALRDAVRVRLARTASWADLVNLGLPGTLVPVADGGLGLDETDLVPILVETGYAAVALPVVETVAVAAPLLAEAGDPRLADVLAGRARVALAGPKDRVPFADRSELVLSLAGGEARIAPLTAAVPVPTVDSSRPLGRIPALGGPALRGDAELAADRAALGTAAQLVGLARRMLDLTVSYVGTRRQFGVPVGSFQAVQHRLADALVALEFAAPAALAAGWAVASRAAHRQRDVSAALVLAVEAAETMARTAIQCHGAIGYTVEYELHRYAKRTWALAAGCDRDAHLARIAEALELKGAQE